MKHKIQPHPHTTLKFTATLLHELGIEDKNYGTFFESIIGNSIRRMVFFSNPTYFIYLNNNYLKFHSRWWVINNSCTLFIEHDFI
jgi:hypothetical protein